MEQVSKLNEAFQNFTLASKSLETYYGKLSERVQYLTKELAKKNEQLNEAILEVRESKDYLHTILQSIGEVIIVLDQDKKITMVNKAAEELLSLNSSDVKGMMFDELNMSIEDIGSAPRLKAKGKVYDVILSHSEVTDPEGTVRGYVVLIKDITRIKELERQQERNQRLISMGEMAAKIVHEVRSPLCSIELFASMLSNDLKGSAHSEMADGISSGIKSLNNILTNMLFFAKPQKPVFKEVNLGNTVKETVQILKALIDVRGISIIRNIRDEIVNGDSELLKQVFMNIVLNAVQSMPDGGNLEINVGTQNKYTFVSVIDEGEGVNPEYVEKIFDPFFSTKDKGTGLGLAIAHKIMQCHNGFIKAYKNEGKGSTFSIHFPKKGDEEMEKPKQGLCANK